MNSQQYQSEELKSVSCKDNLIEPLSQKVFSFQLDALEGLRRIKNLRYQKLDSWKPVLQNKKTNEDPKFIISMERKKARAISAIKGNDLVHPIFSNGKMIGSKLSHEKKHRHSHIIKPTTATSYALIQSNLQQYNKIVLKQKKNPHMNFSLLYLQQSSKSKLKKQAKNEVKKEGKKEEKDGKRPKTCRQKGSENPYIESLSHAINAKKRSLKPRGKSASLYRSTHY